MESLKAFIDILSQLILLAGIVSSVYFSWRNGTKIQNVHSQINGRMDQLLELTRTSSKAIGVKEGEATKKAGQ